MYYMTSNFFYTQAVYVMPSSSARCSQLPRAVDKVPFYEALRKYRDHLNGKLPDLKQSEITFEDVVLKTAVKKEVKEEGEDQYPGEMGTVVGNQLSDGLGNMPFTGDQFSCAQPSSGEQHLAHFMSSSYQVIPHSVQSSPQGNVNQSSPVNTQSSGSSPHVETLQVKQEPVDPDCPVTSCQATTSQSETISIGQLEVYNQSQNTSQNDSHLNNFLNGLYGLVNQVAGSNKADSRYGIVNHAGLSTNGPVQFNDALRDIVRESSTDETDTMSPVEELEKPSTSQQTQGKTTKASKPRKRKSKSAEDPPAMSQPAFHVPSADQHYHRQSPSTQGNSQNSFQAMQPVPPFTSHMPQMNMPGHAYTNAYMSQMQSQYPPQTLYGFMQSQPSFTQMMSGGDHFMGMLPHGNLQNLPQQHVSNGFSGQYPAAGQQSNGFNPNLQIKQELPDK